MMKPYLLIAIVLIPLFAGAQKPVTPAAYGKNMIGGGLSVTDEGVGMGLAYERTLDKRAKFSFFLPVDIAMVGYGKNTEDAAPLTLIGSLNKHERILQLSPGVKFYPTGNNGKIRYAAGLQLSYERGYFEERDVTPTANWARLHIQKVGAMANNSVNMNVTAHSYIGADLGIGVPFINQQEDMVTGQMMNVGSNALIQFGIRLGCRF